MPATIDRQKPMEERVSMTLEKPNPPYVEDKTRRAVIKKIAIGTAALAGCNLLPDKWTTPLIEFGALPAHATTSGLVEELVAAMEQAQAETEEKTAAPQAETAKTAPQVETAKTETEEESEWTTVRWGGNPNETSENRDRTWWTKIHGSEWPYWHRKFPLPRWVDDAPYRLEFQFSDGSTFYVSNSTRMEMDSNGPKYVPEDHAEIDPRKKHPKIGAALGAKPTWVRFRKI